MTVNALSANMKSMADIADQQRDWIRSIMERKRISSTRVATDAGLSPSTINRFLTGEVHHNLSATTLHKIASAHGEGLPGPLKSAMGERVVRVVGNLGGGLRVTVFREESEAITEPAPPEIEGPLQAIRVGTDENWPTYHAGDVIYCDEDEQDIESVIGRECWVVLDSGEQLLRFVLQGTAPDLFHLQAHNAPPMTDVRIESAFQVRWIKRA